MIEQESEQKADASIQGNSLVLKLAIVIVDENKADNVTEFLREQHVRFQYAFMGKGTARSDLLDLLGLGKQDKTIIAALTPAFHAEHLIKRLTERFTLSRTGNGIAFTMPLSGVVTPILNLFTGEKMNQLREGIEGYMESDTERQNIEGVRHDLIITVVNEGCCEDVMDAAQSAGANGGTIIHARRTGLEDGAAFLGMPIQAQKDVIMILADRKKKNAIMKAISHDYGLTSDARGIVFSVPVDSVAGLSAINL